MIDIFGMESIDQNNSPSQISSSSLSFDDTSHKGKTHSHERAQPSSRLHFSEEVGLSFWLFLPLDPMKTRLPGTSLDVYNLGLKKHFAAKCQTVEEKHATVYQRAPIVQQVCASCRA